jgi:hypothetical protein
MAGDGLHKGIRSTHKNQSWGASKPSQRFLENFRINPATAVLRPTSSAPRETQQESKLGLGSIARNQFVTEDHVIPIARGIKKDRRDCTGSRSAVE